MEKVAWKVDGITCANCALSIDKALTGAGMKQVAVNVITGDVTFETVDTNGAVTAARSRVESLGYKVSDEQEIAAQQSKAPDASEASLSISKYLKRFFICLPFTLVLMLHMVPGLHLHWLVNPWVQFCLALPVYLVGMEFFGVSAWKSIRSGIPNMNVLIALGSTAAFAYSTYGLFTAEPELYLFFETAASIITIVFFGNWMEDVSVARTQREIKKLTKKQVVMAKMIAYDGDHNEHIFPLENTQLKVGDLVLINTGEQVPMDCKILWGDADVNEAIITGESIPVTKTKGDLLIGGSVLANGTVKALVSAVGKDTVMNSIVELVQRAQTEKPPVQKLADRISGVFIPAVLAIALLTFVGSLTVAHLGVGESLKRAVAVLVIACPCAMGLATPAAIAVGLGRAAKKGILYTDVSRMELFRTIRQMVFDKTGTLTTGKFSIAAFESSLPEAQFKSLVYSLEKFSNHPIAKSIADAWKTKDVVIWKQIAEVKGLGMQAEDRQGNQYSLGSYRVHSSLHEGEHNLYLTRNGEVMGWIDIADELRPEAKDVMAFCRAHGIRTILLSGDTETKCRQVANELGIDEVHAGQKPDEKLQRIEALAAAAPTVMVGDGINDAPALAKATISVSLAQASQLAIQSASVVLTSGGLKGLPLAMQLGKYTYGTIKSNLFWAFIYNIIAIPFAAFGYLHPTFSALIMGGSDVVLAANSLFLGVRKIKV